MAVKTTYIYKVKMWRGNDVPMTEYCYARNAKAAEEGYKVLYKQKRYDHFNSVCFAEADYKLHPDLFKPLTDGEAKTVIDGGFANADMYSRRLDNKPLIPEDAVFVPVEKKVSE